MENDYEKNLKFLISLVLVVLSFSITKKTQGMDSLSEKLDKNSSGSSSLFHLDRGTDDTINQEIINNNQFPSHSPIEYGSRPETAPSSNDEIQLSEETSLKVSNTHFVLPLIEGSARLIKGFVSYTVDHAWQSLLAGLACLVTGVASCDCHEPGCYDPCPGWWQTWGRTTTWAVVYTTVGVTVCACCVCYGYRNCGSSSSSSTAEEYYPALIRKRDGAVFV